MKYQLYQVQLESRHDTYCFEIGTNDYDAVEIAKIYLAEHCPEHDFTEYLHLGGYDNIGTTDQYGVVRLRMGIVNGRQISSPRIDRR